MASQNDNWLDIITTALKSLGLYFLWQGYKEKNKKDKK